MTFYDVTNCFLGFCAVGNFLFQHFLCSLDFNIKRELFYNGRTPFLWYEFLQIQNVISQLIFEQELPMLDTGIFFSARFELPLNSSFKIVIKKLGDFKLYNLRMNDVSKCDVII